MLHHDTCAKQAQKGGLSCRHGPYSIAAAAAQNGAARPGGYKATVVVASAPSPEEAAGKSKSTRAI